MKKMLTLGAALVTALTLFTPAAEASPGCGPSRGHRTFIGHDRCGNDLYRVSYYAGRDCHGHPIFRTRIETVKCYAHRDRCDDRGGWTRGDSGDRDRFFAGRR